MKASANVSVSEGVFKLNFDIFEAVWGYMLYDNVGIMAEPKNDSLMLFSFSTGKELATVSLSKADFEKLSKCNSLELNYSQGDFDSVIFKNEGIDLTGKLVEGIEAQFAGKNATASNCYKAVIEANPNVFRAYNLLGRCQRADGDVDGAYQSYKKTIDLASWSPEAYCNMGVLFHKKGDEDQAQTYFSKVIDIDNFYFNALIKRGTYLLERDPYGYELKLLNLRLSTVYNDITAAQNHIKSYMEKMNYDRVAYSDKETALFEDYADPKLQKKLKLVEGCVVNGAFGAAVKNMQELLESVKETSAEKRVAGWCHERAERIRCRLPETANDKLFDSVKQLIESTPSEESLKVEAERVAKKEAAEAAKLIDLKAAEAASKAAIAAIENSVASDGDYSQAVGGQREEKITEEEKAAALAEQAFISEAAEPPAPVPASTEVSIPERVVEKGPAPVEVPMPENIAEKGPAPVEVPMPENIAEKGPAPVEVPMPENIVEKGPLPIVSTVSKPQTSDVKLNENYKSPVKGVNPLTIQEFFMLVILEIMRDGEIEESERKFLSNLKSLLKISDEDFTKMFNNVRNLVKAKGHETAAKGKFDPKRVFKKLCAASIRDGVLDESEKKVIFYACKIFKISENEAKGMLAEAVKEARK